MADIIAFPTDRVRKKPLTEKERLAQSITTIEAVNELTHSMLTEVIKIYIDNNWSFAELDLVVGEFKDLMIRNAPANLTRQHVEFMKEHLRPIWTDIVDSIRSSYK